jgi:hypothetical protein
MPEPDLTLAWPERQWRAATTLGWPLGIAATGGLMSLGDVPLCAFKHLSGAPCPLCGATHACAALLDGDLAAAWDANAGILFVLAVAAAHSLVLALEAMNGRRLIASNTPWNAAWMVACGALAANWVFRLSELI